MVAREGGSSTISSMTTRRRILLSGLAAAVLALGALVFVRASATPTLDGGAPQCGDSASVQGCMDDRVLTALGLGGPVVALDALRSEITNSSDRQKGFCHSVAHTLGTRAAQSTVELTELLDEVRGRAALCDFGFLHGALEGYAEKRGSEWLIQYAPPACSRVSADDEQLAGCMHGLGHSVLLAFDGDIRAAVEGCERFERSRDRDACSSGAIMQWSIGSPGSQQRSLSSNDPAQQYWPILCEEMSGTARSGCLSQVWHSLRLYPVGSVERSSSHALEYCNSTYSRSDLSECVYGVGSSIWADGFPDISTAVTGCQSAGVDSHIVRCVLGYAYSRGTHLLSDARMTEVCDSLPAGLRSLCAREAASGMKNEPPAMQIQDTISE